MDDDDEQSPAPQGGKETVLDLNSFFGSKKGGQKREEKMSVWDGGFWQRLLQIGSKTEEQDLDRYEDGIFNISQSVKPEATNDDIGKTTEKNIDFSFLGIAPFGITVEKGIPITPRSELKQKSKASDPAIRLLPTNPEPSLVPSLEQSDIQSRGAKPVLEIAVMEARTESLTTEDGNNFLEIITIKQRSVNEQTKHPAPAKERLAVQNSSSGYEGQPAKHRDLIQSQDVLTEPVINRVVGPAENAEQKTNPTLSFKHPAPEILNIDAEKNNDNLPGVNIPNTTAKSADKPISTKIKAQVKIPIKNNAPELQPEPEMPTGIKLGDNEPYLEEKAFEQTIIPTEIVKSRPEMILDNANGVADAEVAVGLLEKLSLPDNENGAKEPVKTQKSIKEISTNPMIITEKVQQSSKDPAETHVLEVTKPAEIPANELARTGEAADTPYNLRMEPLILTTRRQIRALDKMLVKVALPAEIEEYKELPDASDETKNQAGATEATLTANPESRQVAINPRHEPRTKPENKNAGSFAQKAMVLKRETAFNRSADFGQKSRAREVSVSSILNTLSKLQDSIPEPKTRTALALNEKPAIAKNREQQIYPDTSKEPAGAFQMINHNRAISELKKPAKIKPPKTKAAAKYYEADMARQSLISIAQLQQDQTDLTDTQAITLKMAA